MFFRPLRAVFTAAPGGFKNAPAGWGTLKLITIDIVIVGPLHSDILFLHPNSFAYYRKAE